MQADTVESPSHVETWAQSSWFKLVVVLVVAGVVTTVVAMAWVGVVNNNKHHGCDVKGAQNLLDDIEAATPQKGENTVVRFFHQDLCFSNTTTIKIPAGVTVNITAPPPINLLHFRFMLQPSAQLYLSNVTLKLAIWTSEKAGGAAVQVNGAAPPPVAPTAEAVAGVARRPHAQVNTTFKCENCTFESNVLWTRGGEAKGGAVYVNGKTAEFECRDCTFRDNSARAIGVGAIGEEDAWIEGSKRDGPGQNATVHGGAIYVGQGNITLIKPRYQGNLALCMPKANSKGQGCGHDGNDVYLETGAVESGCKDLAPHYACGAEQCEDYTLCSHHADKAVLAPCGVHCKKAPRHPDANRPDHPPTPPTPTRSL